MLSIDFEVHCNITFFNTLGEFYVRYIVSKRKDSSTGRRWQRLAGLILAVVVLLAAGYLPVMAQETSLEPLDSAWKNVIVPKHRAIVSFMNSDWGITTFRGQDEEIKSGTLDAFYGKDVLTTTAGSLVLSGSDSSRVFSMAQAPGTVRQTVTLEEGKDFMGMNTFDDVPTGVFCSSYFTMLDSDGDTTEFWMELTGTVEKTGETGRIGRVKLTGIPRPYYKYKFNADGSHVYAPTLDKSRAHDMLAWDWDEDGYTDWLVSYVSNPSGEKDHKNMKVIFVFIDGLSLYKASKGEGSVNFWYNKDVEYTTGGDVIGGLTTRKPPNSVRTAIGDMDGDGKPEVALYYTKVQGTTGMTHNNHMKILQLAYNGVADPTWSWFYEKGEDIGKWHVQYDSVAVAMGDLDGDGKAELAVLHGNADVSNGPSTLYLDVYKIVETKIKKMVEGENVGETAEMPKDKEAAPGLEAAIDDLDGDGIGELVWVETYAKAAYKLNVVVAKWPSGFDGSMKKYSTDLVDLVNSWTLDETYPRFSMSVGRFIYPEKDTLQKQIGLVTTASGSSGKLGLRWGIFEWDSSGMKVLGSGNQSNGMKESNVVPSLVAADLDRGSMILGKPSGFTVYDSIEPIFITQAPPKHWDVLSIDGEEKIMDAFSVLKGYSTTMNGKTSDSYGESTTKSSSGSWGGSAGLSVMKNHLIKPSTKVFDVALEYAGTTAAQNTKSKTVTTSFALEFTAEYDDQIYYRANTHDVWRYPVLAPRSQAFAVDDDGVSYRRFIQFIVPKVINSSFSPTAGRFVDWYEPRHNGLNLFSYPRKLEQTRDFPLGKETKDPKDLWKDINGVVLSRSTGQIMGNPDSSEATFTIESKEHTDTLKSLKNTISGYANLNLPAVGKLMFTTLGNFSLNGDGTWGTDSTTTKDTSKLGGVTISWPGVAGYESPSGMLSGELVFTVDAAIYASDGGALSVAYAVTNLKRQYSGIWGADSPYSKTPDPALNLPRQWVANGNKWQRNNYDGDAHRIRGVVFEGASLVASGGVSGQVMPIDTDISATFRVFNYSFVPTGSVVVTLGFQQISSLNEEPDISKSRVLTTKTLASIPGRDYGTTDNWQDMKVSFTTPDTEALGYLHIALSTDGGNLSTDNDTGHLLVGVYDPAKHDIAGKAMGRAETNAAAGESLSILSGSMSVRPLQDDGSLGAETASLAAGRTAVVTANIRYDNPGAAAGEGALLFVHAYLRDGAGIAGHKTIPLLKNSEENTVQMYFTSKTDASIPLQMIVTADTLPALQDANPKGRVAQIVLNGGSSDSGSGGGCAVGVAPVSAALLLALPLLLLKKR